MKSYKNDWFARELVNASAKRTLEEAAPEWEFSHFGYLGKGGNCQICHTHILRFVAIKNRRNGIVLLIGEDCYDKLQYYLATQKLEAVTLQSRKQYIGQIKKYCKKEINAAFLEWFNGQGGLPETIKNTIGVIKQLGYAPSLKAAEEIVDYYKNHRFFPINELLGREWEVVLKSFPWSSLSQNITITQLQGIKKSLEEWEKKWESLEKTLWGVVARNGNAKVEGVKEGLVSSDASVQVELSHRKRRFGIVVSVSDIEKRLGRGINWTDNYLAAFKETAPARIGLWATMRRGLILSGDQLQDWVREVRKVIQLEERKKNAIGLTFKKGWNRKHNTEQWEARLSGVLYVLRKEDRYDPSEAEVKVMKVFDLVPGRVILVER